MYKLTSGMYGRLYGHKWIALVVKIQYTGIAVLLNIYLHRDLTSSAARIRLSEKWSCVAVRADSTGVTVWVCVDL